MAVGKDRLYFSFREDKIFDFRAVIQNTFLRLLATSISQNRFLFIFRILWSAMGPISGADAFLPLTVGPNAKQCLAQKVA